MATFVRETWLDAPLADVWAFHSTIEGLTVLTPDWLGLRVWSVYGPDGDPDPDELDVGAVVRLSIRPFGDGVRQTWTTRIVEREADDAAAMFRDVMVDGPFEEWVHTHQFYADRGGTLLRDVVAYELPFGPLGHVGTPFARAGLAAMFSYRHRRTHELLE